ncbi:MAG: AAA family ATPase, partial [Kovacikia sp.]
MIPQRLTLKNFFSYREATLDFRGLHTACICGANGAGKSSLLEAIAWAVWGQSRAAVEDDVIHIGAKEAQVDFIFVNNHQTYRILRSRYRGQATTLEFQIASEGRGLEAETLPSPLSFRPLTAKGVRATQQLILEHLKLDYETFANSAYLRQGRADEFMLKRPAERKEILADLLKLNQYEELAEKAKDQARQLKGQTELLERNLESIANQLQQRQQIFQEQSELEAVLAALQQQQTADTDQLQTLQSIQHQRQAWQQQLSWQQQQQRNLMQDCQRLQQEAAAAQQQQQEVEGLLHQEAAIATGYHHFQTLQTQEEVLSGRLEIYQAVQLQRQQYQQQQTEKAAALKHQLQQTESQLNALREQETEIQPLLSKAADVAAALEQLQQARACLSQLDQLHLQASPLLQRRQQLQTQLDHIHTRQTTRLDELRLTAQQLQMQQQQQPQLQQAMADISDRIEALEH